MLILFTILRLRFLVQGTYSIDATELKKKRHIPFKNNLYSFDNEKVDHFLTGCLESHAFIVLRCVCSFLGRTISKGSCRNPVPSGNSDREHWLKSGRTEV